MGRRKKKTEEEGGDSLLQMMTVSLFIILLAFFIMLNAIAVVDENRKRVALGSLMENFGILSGGYSLLQGSDDRFTPNNMSKVNSLMDFSDLIKDDEQLAQDLILTEDRKRSVLSIPEHRLFNPGEDRLIPDSEVMLYKLGKIISKHQYPVDIIGFMDKGESEIHGWPPPRELSTLRAMRLQSFFIQKAKVDPKMLTAYGWGEYRPIASNKTRETRQMNRRVEVVFIHDTRSDRPEGAFTFKDFFFNVFEKKGN